jgi:hypothetical protein
VLPADRQEARLEVSLPCQDSLLGPPITDFGIYIQTVRPDGVLQGDVHHMMISANREVADWLGGGAGRPIGVGVRSTYGACGCFDSAQGALARHDTMATPVNRRLWRTAATAANVGIDRRTWCGNGGDKIAPGDRGRR